MPGQNYWNNLLCSRSAIDGILSLFMKYDIHATWATVGLLFARNATDLIDYLPAIKPEYKNYRLNPYRILTGENERDDPLHFAVSIIEKIRKAPFQEVGSHTFSHYYALEPGQTADAFREDLLSAKSIARNQGIDLRSLVFPRNQVNPAYLSILSEIEFESYRGNQNHFLYNMQNAMLRNSKLLRFLRLADSYLNLTGHNTVKWTDLFHSHPINIRASSFLRPCMKRMAILDSLKCKRITTSLRYAAERNEIFHLWWHPHNFGLNLKINLKNLENILKEFDSLRQLYGMRSLNMSEIADETMKIGVNI